MKSKIVPVKNVARLSEAGFALLRRAPGMPGMGLVHGETGFGKTTAIAWLAARSDVNAVYVRAMATWTPSAMLGAICKQLRLPEGGSCSQQISRVIESLAMSARPLFIDEADYIVDSKRMSESLRDVHDMATVPVVLVGMGGIDLRLAHRKQLSGRFFQEVRFGPLDEEDAGKLAHELCEVKIKPDLLADMVRNVGGSARLIVIALGRMEQLAKSRGVDQLGLAEWGKRAYFTGEAPNKPTGAI